MREALRDALADLKLFLTQVSAPTKEDGALCPNVIWYNSKYHASSSPLKTCSSKTTNMTCPCIIPDTHGQHTSREYKLILGLLIALFPKDFFIFLASH